MNFASTVRHLPILLFGSRIDLSDLDVPARRRIRAAQIGAVVELVPLTMSVNLLNALIVVLVFWHEASPAFLLSWAAVMMCIVILGFWSWARTRQRKPDGASERAIHRVTIHATLMGGLWGITPIVLFYGSHLEDQFVLACLIAGMISGGAFCLSTVPKAGLLYTWTLIACSVVGLLRARNEMFVPVAVLLVLYGIFISRNAVAHGRLFKSYLRDKLKMESQSDLIGLLLNDFQEHASDWLWEADANGVLNQISERFAEAAGKNPAAMQGLRLADILANEREACPPEIVEIVNHMKGRRPFRDIVAPVRIGGEQRYWLMSAKPVFDYAGKFTGYHGVGADVTEQRQAQERISHLAYFDTITGLANRVSFREGAGEVLAAAASQNQSAALLCLDLDQFKSVNDTLGHPVGDELLKAVGQRIRACTREDDIVARLGGDEFAILQIYPERPGWRRRAGA